MNLGSASSRYIIIWWRQSPDLAGACYCVCSPFSPHANAGLCGGVMNIFDVLYRQARADHAKAMLKCRSESRPEALSQAEQNERFKGYEVPSTSKELEMTCLKDPQTLAENAHSPVSEDAPADIGMILGRILNRLS